MTCVKLLGEQKVPVDEVELRAEHGIVGDAHAGKWHRQVSLLADEDVETMRGKGIDLNPGDFAENITTEGIVLSELPGGRLCDAPAGYIRQSSERGKDQQ